MFKTITTAMEEIGVYVDFDINDLDNENYDVNLQDYISDSILFITFIIKIEEALGIELPDDILLFDQISSIKSFAVNLEETVKNCQ
ncbi:MAG: acyl carrier protein [Ruminococcaceae bacterium]|nr:acyl carrier protein [Oscillospiraceae bacterium]